MAPATAEVLAAVLSLPRDEREALRDELDRSLADDAQGPAWEAAWRGEVDRRIAEVRSGQVETIAADDAHAQVRATLAALPR